MLLATVVVLAIMPIMSVMPPERPGEGDPLPPGFPLLNDAVYEGTNDPILNGFMSMYQMLPERRMTRSIGSELVVETVGNGQNPNFAIVAALGETVIGVDKTPARSPQTYTPYVYLHGSFYVSDAHAPGATEAVTKLAMTQAVLTEAKGGRRLEGGLLMVYARGVFCKDALIAHSKAYPVDALRGPELRERTLRAPLGGDVVTVTVNQRTETLFVEKAVQFTGAVRNIYQRAGDTTVALLDYDYPE